MRLIGFVRRLQRPACKSFTISTSSLRLEESFLGGLEQLDIDGYANLLRQSKSLESGKRIHIAVIESRFSQDRYLNNLIIEMYAKCGSLEDARLVFESTKEWRNVFTWTIIITAYAQKRHCTEALHLFRAMLLEGTFPDRVTFVSVLRACSGNEARGMCKGIHALVVAAGVEGETSIGNSLVRAYSLCEDVANSYLAFDGISRKNLTSWNNIIISFQEYGLDMEVVELYHQMEADLVTPNGMTFTKVLGACSNLGDLTTGRLVHERLVECGFGKDVYVTNALLNMYVKCGEFDEASRMLEGMEFKDVVSWNTILAAYSQAGKQALALDVLRHMDLEGVKASSVTLINLLAACECLTEGRMLHSRIVGEVDVNLKNALVSMYGRCGNLQDAKVIFEGIVKKNVVSWNCLIAGYVDTGEYDGALEVYHKMVCEGLKQDVITYMRVLGACACLKCLTEGILVHRQVSSIGLDQEVSLANALTSMYVACGMLKSAREVFNATQAKNVVTWTAMLSAYVENGECEEAMRLFSNMQLDGVKPNEVTFSSVMAAGISGSSHQRKVIHSLTVDAGLGVHIGMVTELVTMYGKCGELEEALTLFEGFKGKKNSCLWMTMVEVYARQGHMELAWETYHKMIAEGIEPEEMNSATALSWFANSNNISNNQLFVIQSTTAKLQGESLKVANCLVDLHSRAGNMEHAKQAFQGIKVRDVISWSSMIAAYARNGCSSESLETYQEMELEGVQASDVTFVSILSSCSHAGMLKKGLEHFASMKNDYGFNPRLEHYGCMVDLLGRVGRVSDAQDLIDNMPYEPTGVQWLSLLHSSKIQFNMEQAKKVVQLMQDEQVPKNSG